MMGLLRGIALLVMVTGVAVAQPKPAAPTQAQKDKIKELKIEGEACARIEDIKPPDPKPEPKPDPKPQVTGTVKIEAAPARPGHTMKLAGIGVVAVGAVALGLGIRFGLQAKDKSDQIS